MKKHLPLNPPVYQSLEKNYKANLIFTIGWAWIIGVTGVICCMVALIPAFWLRAGYTVISVDLVALFTLYLNHKGQLKSASLFFSFSLWLIASLLALTSGGINAPAIVAYLPVIITSGFLLGGAWGVAMAFLCVLTSFALVQLQLHNMLPPPVIKHTPVTLLLAYSISGILIAIMQYLITGHISTSIETIIHETDERMNAENKLRQSEFNNRMVVENKILGVAWADADGRVIDTSKTFCEMLGYKPGELNGIYFGDFTHPEDTEKELRLIERIMNREMDSYTLEKRYRQKNGSYLWVELHLTCYRKQDTGEIDFFIGLIQNIQQRKEAEAAQRESEAQYRSLVENAAEALLVYDVDLGHFVSVSESAVQLMKMPKELFLKKGPADISPEYQPDGQPSADKSSELIKAAINGSKPVFEWVHLDAEGKQLQCEVRLVKLPSASRTLIRVSMVDISQRKLVELAAHNLNAALEKKVSERTAELETVNNDLFKFNTMLSHDLRSAIRRIKSFSDLLSKKAQKGIWDEHMAADIEMMKKDAARMDGIVTGLLEMSKLGARPVQLKPVNTAEVVNLIIADLNSQWQHKNPEVKMDELPVVSSDPILLQQVFANLLSNAYKYSGKNDIIKVTVKYTSGDNRHLFTISDNGVGFDMKEHDNLFKEFTRLHHDTDFEGTGLGLNNVKRFVEKLGGQIWAESEPGQGSVFYFTLPAEKPAVQSI